MERGEGNGRNGSDNGKRPDEPEGAAAATLNGRHRGYCRRAENVRYVGVVRAAVERSLAGRRRAVSPGAAVTTRCRRRTRMCSPPTSTNEEH